MQAMDLALAAPHVEDYSFLCHLEPGFGVSSPAVITIALPNNRPFNTDITPFLVDARASEGAAWWKFDIAGTLGSMKVMWIKAQPQPWRGPGAISLDLRYCGAKVQLPAQYDVVAVRRKRKTFFGLL